MQKKTKQFYYKKHGSFFKGCDVHMFFVEEILVSSITIRFLYNVAHTTSIVLTRMSLELLFNNFTIIGCLFGHIQS